MQDTVAQPDDDTNDQPYLPPTGHYHELLRSLIPISDEEFRDWGRWVNSLDPGDPILTQRAIVTVSGFVSGLRFARGMREV